MRPMLDDLELPQVQQIVVDDRRFLAEHKPPGMDGSLLQNLGRRPTTIRLRGVATGPATVKFVEDLDARFRAGRAVPFTADIVAEADIQKVVFDDLDVWEDAGKPERVVYEFVLREHIDPVEPAGNAPLDADVVHEARRIVDRIATGLAALDVLRPFVPRLTGLLASLDHQGPDVLAPRS